jgi:hypothetical protein
VGVAAPVAGGAGVMFQVCIRTFKTPSSRTSIGDYEMFAPINELCPHFCDHTAHKSSEFDNMSARRSAAVATASFPVGVSANDPNRNPTVKSSMGEYEESFSPASGLRNRDEDGVLMFEKSMRIGPVFKRFVVQIDPDA